MRFRNVLTNLFLAFGALALLVGFLLLQWISALGIGMTGLQIAMDSIRPGTLISLTNDAGRYQWLWLIPATGVLVLLAVAQLFRHTKRNNIIIKLLVLVFASISFYPFFVFFSSAMNSTSTQAVNLIGLGFWIALVGNIIIVFSALFSG